MIPFSVLLAALFAIACSGPASDQVFEESAPNRASWDPVEDALAVHCGTLDCHGSSSRNFRLYGIYGQRIGRQITGTSATTEEEYTAAYESIVMLQPEVLTSLVRDQAADPQRWIVVTKGRGTEQHKGGSRMTAGDATDTCLLSWVAGKVVDKACTDASAVLPPEGF